MPATPIRFDPTMEQPAADEAETSAGLNEALRSILETTSQDYGHAVRSVHAKAHGIFRATLTVQDGLPPELAQGLFATPGAYPAIVRISTNPGDILDDSISVPRGLALKVLDVAGERLPGSEADTTQDFVMANAPAFGAPEPKAFLKTLKLLAKTTDKAEGAKKALSAVLRGIDTALGAVGIDSATVKQIGGAPQVHPLGETYYSQVPFLYGPYVAKFALVPTSPGLRAVAGHTVVIAGRADALREEVTATLAEQGGTWDLRVQLRTDPDAMPIEDASVVWDEATSPFVTVATLTAEPQAAWAQGTSEAADDALAFSVWHGLAAHRPLGAINRVRKPAYAMSADFRARFNGCPMHEPRTLTEIFS